MRRDYPSCRYFIARTLREIPRHPARRYYDKRTTVDFDYRAAARLCRNYSDTRGRFVSDGDFYDFRDEASDGYDIVEMGGIVALLEREGRDVGCVLHGRLTDARRHCPSPHLDGICSVVTRQRLSRWLDVSGGAPD